METTFALSSEFPFWIKVGWLVRHPTGLFGYFVYVVFLVF
jgi:hypothetical protein